MVATAESPAPTAVATADSTDPRTRLTADPLDPDVMVTSILAIGQEHQKASARAERTQLTFLCQWLPLYKRKIIHTSERAIRTS